MGDCEVWARTQARAPVYMRVCLRPHVLLVPHACCSSHHPPGSHCLLPPHTSSRAPRPAGLRRASRTARLRCGQSYTAPPRYRVSMTPAAVCALHACSDPHAIPRRVAVNKTNFALSPSRLVVLYRSPSLHIIVILGARGCQILSPLIHTSRTLSITFPHDCLNWGRAWSLGIPILIFVFFSFHLIPENRKM